MTDRDDNSQQKFEDDQEQEYQAMLPPREMSEADMIEAFGTFEQDFARFVGCYEDKEPK